MEIVFFANGTNPGGILEHPGVVKTQLGLNKVGIVYIKKLKMHIE